MITYDVYCDDCDQHEAIVSPNAAKARDEARRRGWSLGKRTRCAFCVQASKVRSARGGGRI